MELIYTLKLYDKNVTFPMHGQILLLSSINLRILGGSCLEIVVGYFLCIFGFLIICDSNSIAFG